LIFGIVNNNKPLEFPPIPCSYKAVTSNNDQLEKIVIQLLRNVVNKATNNSTTSNLKASPSMKKMRIDPPAEKQVYISG